MKIGALRPDSGESAYFERPYSDAQFCATLNKLSEGAAFVLGHNIKRHDLVVLHERYPELALLTLPVIDTLELSPLAFPENPYHRLVKDYKLQSDSRNNPLRDAELSLALFLDEKDAFIQLQKNRPDEVGLHHYLIGAERTGGGLSSFFMSIRHALEPEPDEARKCFERVMADKVCDTRLQRMLHEDFQQDKPPSHIVRAALSYVVAWMRVAGGNSVLPPWVCKQLPDSARLIEELRTVACDQPTCAYCRRVHSPEAQLAQHFNLPGFKPTPTNASGGSLQRDIVAAGMHRESLLAILPTGAGKSLCYQLPALCHYWRSGQLTVVVSPLQSLMKDQIDNLVRRGIYGGVAINGLLTPPERRAALDRVRLGDAGIVLVSPEQFRNRSFSEALKWREVATWVFDEAHCLSRWGHDFRPDYLYVARFIRERQGGRPATVACFTATAKLEVITDLREHFKTELGIGLTQFLGGHERSNLEFEILSVHRAEKTGRILELLNDTLAVESGSAVVFAATRKHAETLAESIAAAGWPCAFFHAGLEAGPKREIQQNFIAGSLRIIVATNAFGMGVDKPDVRLVVHADIPGSLENYLQEAGRAGRDSVHARCVLLYDEEDVETQFSLAARSQLTHRDLIGVLKAVRKRQQKFKQPTVVVTPRELLLDADESNIDAQALDADTKVKTAIAWLERAALLRREENETHVFPASLNVSNLDEANAKLHQANLPEPLRERYANILAMIMSSDAADGLSTDDIMASIGATPQEIFHALNSMAALGLLTNDLGLRAVLRQGVVDASETRLDRICRLERALVEVMSESAPDAQEAEDQVVGVRELCDALRERIADEAIAGSIIPESVLDLLRAMAHSFGEGSSKRSILTFRKAGSLALRVRVQRPWSQIREITQRRQLAATVILKALLAQLPAHTRSADAIVECKAGDLLLALQADLEARAMLRDPATALEQALLYLHDTEVLILDKGRTVMRSAMTLRVLSREGGMRVLKSDFAPLERHYRERTFQIHVMNEYAKRGLRKVADALALVASYFAWSREQFVKSYFGQCQDLIELATTVESFQRIVDVLHHPVQEQLVQEREGVNRLVLAGPGSGKTRVIVHRVAYLLRVLRAPAESIIVLAFNRSAAVQVRHRLHALVGNDAVGVTVLTYHALALRLTGTRMAQMVERGDNPVFDAVLRKAIDLLNGRMHLCGDPDDLRERLLQGYRFILVDEYQDIDQTQYDLISALAGRNRSDGDSKLTIMAVGDDDQNIYAFRQTNVSFIADFERDYHAQRTYLVENFRSSAHIIHAANHLIASLPERMKVDHPIRIDRTRGHAAAGGAWSQLDGEALGRVQLIRYAGNANVQAQLAMMELQRLRALKPDVDWSTIAIIGRNHETLEPIRAYCQWRGIGYRTGTERALPAYRTREGHRTLTTIGRRKGLLRPTAVARWLALASRAEEFNVWMEALRDSMLELAEYVGDRRILRSEIMEWIYETSQIRARETPGHLNLLTAHASKGREFHHVVILDGGDWTEDSPEERRLLYVAMTRAKETLAIFQRTRAGNPMLEEMTDLQDLRTVNLTVLPLPLAELNRLHRELTLEDVFIDFCGRMPATNSVHQAIAQLRVGDGLFLEDRDIMDLQHRIVGRLAQRCVLPDGEVRAMKVAAIVHRSKHQTAPSYSEALRVDEWEVVLPEMVLQPIAPRSAPSGP